jgi:hypothetical protein
MKVTGTLEGVETTSVDVRGTWSCSGGATVTHVTVGMSDPTVVGIDNVLSAYDIGRGVAAKNSGLLPGASGAVVAHYAYPRTGHPYHAGFVLYADLPTGALVIPSYPADSPAPSPACRHFVDQGDSMFCYFDDAFVVGPAPAIGPPASATPVDRSVTVPATSGSCELSLRLTEDPSGLSFTGSSTSTAWPACQLGPGQTFAYADQREVGPPIASGNDDCCPTRGTSSGRVATVSGGRYTVTYFVVLWGTWQPGGLPPECSDTGRDSNDGYSAAYCELTASAVVP